MGFTKAVTIYCKQITDPQHRHMGGRGELLRVIFKRLGEKTLINHVL